MATVIEQFVQHADKRLQMEIMQESLTISKGGCPSHEEYKFRCGQIRGMERAINIVRELLRSVEIEDGPRVGGQGGDDD